MDRQQKLDACAICHSGLDIKATNGALNYRIGDKLNGYFNENEQTVELDVHGNQYGFLLKSKCFKNSPKMTCTTCHNIHENQRGKVFFFNDKCLKCHKKISNPDNHKIDVGNMNCIHCHMPVEFSKTLLIEDKEKDTTVPLSVRSHHIAIYNIE